MPPKARPTGNTPPEPPHKRKEESKFIYARTCGYLRLSLFPFEPSYKRLFLPDTDQQQQQQQEQEKKK